MKYLIPIIAILLYGCATSAQDRTIRGDLTVTGDIDIGSGGTGSTIRTPLTILDDFTVSGVGDVSFATSGTLEVSGTNGVDYNPGSDIDADIFTVGVTGAPRFYWDESASAFVSTVNISFPGAGGGTGDFESDGSVSMSAAIDFDPGGDSNMDMFTVNVTGSPTISWNESNDAFSSNKGLLTTSESYGFRVGTTQLRNWDNTTDPIIDGLTAGSTFGTLIQGEASGHMTFAVNANDSTDGFQFLYDTDHNGTLDLLMLEMSAVNGFRWNSTYTFNLVGQSGIDQTPTTDQDADLFTVNVTGTPRFQWDESEDTFDFTKGLDVFGDVEATAFNSTTNTGALTINTGLDQDLVIWSLGVTGTPQVVWDESEDRYSFQSAGIRTELDSYFIGTTTHQGNLDVIDAGGDSNVLLYTEATGGAIRVSDETGNDAIYLEVGSAGAGEILVQNSSSQLKFDLDADNEVNVNNLQWDFNGVASSLGFRIESDGHPFVNHADGIEFYVAGDADRQILDVTVTGAPTLSWDESENKFSSTHGILLDGTSGQSPELTLWDSTGDTTWRTYFGSFGSVTNWANLSAATRASILVDSGDDGVLALNDGTTTTIRLDGGAASEFVDGIKVLPTVLGGTVNAGITSDGVFYGNKQSETLGFGGTNFTVTGNFVELTGDGTGNNLTAILGMPAPGLLTIVCTDTNVTFVDDNTHLTNTLDLPSNITSADDKLIQLYFDGTSFYHVSTSTN